VSGIPEIQGEYSSTFKRIIVAGVFGTTQPLGLETAIYSEERKIDRVITTEPMSTKRMMLKRIVECELIFDPMQMKTFYKWLGTKIEEYENVFGRIPSPEELQSRTRRLEGET
jgi:hypothetical protein